MAARILSGLILGPGYLGLLWLGGWPFAVLTSVLAGLGAAEFVKMERKPPVGPFLAPTVAWSASFALAFHALGLEAGTLLLTGLAPLLVVPAVLRGTTEGEGRAAAVTLFGVVVFGFMFSFPALVRDGLADGRVLGLVLAALVWGQDTAAYFVGVTLGRHKLCAISPKKTWEGTAAGLAGGVGLAYAVAAGFGLGYAAAPWFLASLALAGAAGQFGDLLESLVKREAGVKDSGALIPGHGGILDRFDSMCGAAPVFFLLLRLAAVPK